MKIYEATALYDASAAGNFSVEAESLEQALEALEEQVAEHSASLCHQCSAKLNLGDMTGMIVYCDEQEVADTTFSGERIAKLESEAQALREEVAALRARVVVIPEGYALVPVEPTREMWTAINKEDDKAYAGGCDHGAQFDWLWQAAIDAAPRLNGKALIEGLLRRVTIQPPAVCDIEEQWKWQREHDQALDELRALLGEGKEGDGHA